MAKVKGPFFSFGAQNTLGNSLTAVRYKRRTVFKTIPTHPDAKTPAQLYQRYRFRDAQYYWLHQTPTQKAEWRALKYPAHLTGHQACIRWYLRNLPHPDLHLPLDEPTGTIAYDSSRNHNDATIFGPTSQPGIIVRARDFDGLDDYIRIPNDPTLSDYTAKTVALWIHPDPHTPADRYIYYDSFFHAPYGDLIFGYENLNRINIYLRSPANDRGNALITITPDTWSHLAYSWDGTTVTFYLNGAYHSHAPFPGPLACHMAYSYLGVGRNLAWHYPGLIDDFRIYRSGLSADQIAYLAFQYHP